MGIFSLDSTTGGRTAETTRRFLARMEAEQRVMVLTADIPKSFVVTLDCVYLVPVSAATLRQRLNRRLTDFGADLAAETDLERDTHESE